ncbi:MAG: DUF885 family protein [Candidatus Cloacimonetes bacterium]|nr:DUF885 family protein [Candidatus Cloacimonadota bacterium]
MSSSNVRLLHLHQRVLDSLQEALPHLASRNGLLAWAGRWPDLAPESRARLLARVRAWSDELRELAGDTLPQDPATVHLLDRLERLTGQLAQPLDPFDLAETLSIGLRDLLMLPIATLPERAGALVQRLRGLPLMMEQVRVQPVTQSPWRARQAAAAIMELARWLDHGAEGWLKGSDESLALLRREAPAARETLFDLATLLAGGSDSRPTPLGDAELGAVWKGETGREWHPDRLEKQLERERNRLLLQLEQQAQHFGRRFVSATTSPSTSHGRDLAELLHQLGQDTPQVEQWEAYQNHQLRDLSLFVERTGLLPENFACPELLPRTWQEPVSEWDWLPTGRQARASLFFLDIAALDGPAQLEFVQDRNTWAMQVLLAREALPGRLWLMQHWRGLRAAGRLLNRAADADGWALLAPELLTRVGWGQAESRMRIMLLKERIRDHACALADLRWHRGSRGEEDLLASLSQQGLMPLWLARLQLECIQREPGRALLAMEKLDALRQLESRLKKTWSDELQSGDIVDQLAACADLPIHWLRKHGDTITPGGRCVSELPSPLTLLRQHNRDDLVVGLEEQLAALGRIQREDLEAGREFDLVQHEAGAHSSTLFGSAEEDDSALADPDGIPAGSEGDSEDMLENDPEEHDDPDQH